MQEEAVVPREISGILLTRLDDPMKRYKCLQLPEEIKRVRRLKEIWLSKEIILTSYGASNCCLILAYASSSSWLHGVKNRQ